MTTIATRAQTTDLVLAPDQTEFNEKQVQVLRTIGVDPNASRAELAMFFHQCARTGLDPFARQIHMIGRRQTEGGQKVVRQTIQTGIDGYRLIARRAADATGETLAFEPTEWCGPDGQWVDVWVSKDAPRAARVVVVRNGQRYPGIALWAEYVQTKFDGSPTAMWSRMPANQLAKCAEAQALRRAFPQDLSGVYVDDEMAPTDVGPAPARSTRVVSAAAQAINDRVARSATPEYIDADADPQAAEQAREDARNAAPADDEPPVPDEAAITQDQLKALHASLNDNGHRDRPDKLTFCGSVIDRAVGSTADLTRREASRVLDALNAMGQDEPPEPADD